MWIFTTIALTAWYLLGDEQYRRRIERGDFR